MITIRKNTFETNSSSTHSIIIPKNVDNKKDFTKSIYFGLGEFGWSRDVADPADYLYTAICDAYLDSYYTAEHQEKGKEYLQKIKDILDKNGITYKFEEINKKEFNYFYVDHCNELDTFIEKVCNDEDLLLRYLKYGVVYTGNDNDDYDESYHYFDAYYKLDPENYDYFYKSN